MPKYLLFLLFLLYSLPNVKAASGEQVMVQFSPLYDGKPLILDDMYYKLPSGDSIVFETFKCYISSIVLYNKDAVVYNEPNSFHLLNMNESASMLIHLQAAPANYDMIQFNIGIDSTTNVSGVFGGDLDPTNGMYWAWQSGFINMKLEGRSNLCPTRNNAFQFHLGGYHKEMKAIQTIALKTQGKHINIGIPIDKFLSGIDLSKQHAIMIPCREAVQLSKKMAGVFEVTGR